MLQNGGEALQAKRFQMQSGKQAGGGGFARQGNGKEGGEFSLAPFVDLK